MEGLELSGLYCCLCPQSRESLTTFLSCHKEVSGSLPMGNLFWWQMSKAGHRLCDFLSFSHGFKETKLLDSPISTVSVDGGINPTALLYSDSGRFPGHQNTMITLSSYSCWQRSNEKNLTGWLYWSRSVIPAKPDEFWSVYGKGAQPMALNVKPNAGVLVWFTKLHHTCKI